jgi:Ni/Fe-hydrogenase subunit HybB-like protein
VTRTTLLLAALVAVMAAVLGMRFLFGLGSVTHLSDGYPWGIWIAFDVVAGSGLATGGFVTALLVYILHRGEYHPMVRPALLAALFGYMQAGLSVFFDLGRYWDFWHILWPRYWQVNSVLFEVALCITAYIVVMWIEMTPIVLERFGLGGPRRRLERLLFLFVAIGVLLPVMHQSSLGSLLVVLGPQIHPLYQTPLLPLLFLISCVGMGFAAVVLESTFSALGLRRPFERELLGKLVGIGRALLALFLVVRFADLALRGQLGRAFEAGGPAATFWLENALFALPLALLATARQRARMSRVFLSGCAMAAGGVVYRLSAYLVAYDTGPGWRYFPSIGEIAVSAGLVAFEVLAFIVCIRLLPIFSPQPPPAPPPRAPDGAAP